MIVNGNVNIQFKLKVQYQKNAKLSSISNPFTAELVTLNDQIRHLVSSQDIVHKLEVAVMEQLDEIIRTCSDALPKKQPEQKRPYVSYIPTNMDFAWTEMGGNLNIAMMIWLIS